MNKLERIFDNVLKESDENYISKSIRRHFEAINATKDPTLALNKLQIPFFDILTTIIRYSHLINLRETKTKILHNPSLPDIEFALAFYAKNLGDFLDKCEVNEIKVSELISLNINRKKIIQSLKYGIKATKKTKNLDERRIIIEVISQSVNAINIYINFNNGLITNENTRREQKNISLLELIEPITYQEIGISFEN